jgi:hypothetical protein
MERTAVLLQHPISIISIDFYFINNNNCSYYSIQLLLEKNLKKIRGGLIHREGCTGEKKSERPAQAVTWRRAIGLDASLRCHLAAIFSSVGQLIIARSSGEKSEEFPLVLIW